MKQCRRCGSELSISDALALLDAALVVRRLEAWLTNHGRSQWTFDVSLTSSKVTIDYGELLAKIAKHEQEGKL